MAEKLTDEQFAAIEEKHPGVRLARIPTAAGEIVIRAPTVIEEGNFQTMYYGNGMTPGIAWKNLLVMCAVYPDKPTLMSWLNSWTGISTNPRVLRALKMIRGEADDEEAK